MVIKIKKRILLIAIAIAIALSLFALFIFELNRPGADAYADGIDYNERFQRPSKQLPLPNPYTLRSFTQNDGEVTFDNPENVIYAYYAILKEASNMIGYYGGCGTIGNADIPYPYAYQLLAPETRENLSLEQFEDSFKGIGHITFLKLHDLPNPQNTPADLKYYMIEIEVIAGPQYKNDNHQYEDNVSYFAYYYGIVTVKKEADRWYIQKIDCLPEDFLCAPYHNWFYESDAIVEIVYRNNLKVIDEITDITEEDGLIYIYATGNGNQYRFDFVRLTNGHDILLNENIMADGKWNSTDLLTDDWRYLKLSISKYDLERCQ